MKPDEIFTLVVKVFGVVLVLQLLNSLVELLFMIDSIGNSGVLTGSAGSFTSGAPSGRILGLALFKIVAIAAGAYWFLRGAPPLPRLAYPEDGACADDNREAQATVDALLCVACRKSIPAGTKYCSSCGWTQPG